MNGTLTVDWATRYYVSVAGHGITLWLVLIMVWIRPRIVKRTATL